MIFVTLKMKLRSQGSILVSAFSWCLCSTNLVRLCKISLQMLSGNLNDLCDLEIMSRSPSSNLAFVLPWCFFARNSVRIRQIFLPIYRGNHLSNVVALNYLCDLRERSMSPGSNLVLAIPWCFRVPNSVRIHEIFLQI